MSRDDLIGVTLEFKDGREEISEEVFQVYSKAPEMYDILHELVVMSREGTASIPEEIQNRIERLTGTEESPDIIKGVFRDGH